MKNKKMKIGASIAAVLLVIIVSVFFMLNNNEKTLDSKAEKNVASEKLKTDNKKDDKSDKDKGSNSEKKPNEAESPKNSEENKETEKQNAANAVTPATPEEDGNTSNGVSGEGNPGSNEVSNPNPPSEPSQPEDNVEVVPEKKEKYVTMSITCNTILNNLDKVVDGKKDIVPSNGVILGEITVQINEGDTVFDVLVRETRSRRIHMDFVESPVYNSAYIKGIANLYEFDAGDLSGWMYSVNGSFPGYGCSQYKLNDGDVIQWKYTCDLGNDL